LALYFFPFAGTKANLLKIRVLPDGSFLEQDEPLEPGVVVIGTRFKELQLLRSKAAEESRDGNLERLGEQILQNGVGSYLKMVRGG
jgi:hypothetical protein